MSATIGNFYERVSRAIRRGTVYDDDIPGYAADAVRELENLQDWKYMWTRVSTSLTISATDNWVTPLLTDVKNVRFIHLVSLAGERIPLRKAQEDDLLQVASGRPGAYWMMDENKIGLDAYPDAAYPYVLGYFAYSAWPLVDSLRWLTMAEELLIARTIRKMQPILRDDKLLKRWSEIEASTLPALQEKELVAEHDGEESVMVPFTREVEEDISDEAVF